LNQNNLIIPQDYYLSDDVVMLAKDLLGKSITTFINNEVTSGVIVETEAYRGPDDRGCHAYGDRYTERTKIMYEDGGVAYVYVCYGMHPMMNIVTGTKGNAHAVLIRAIEPIIGNEIMAKRRNIHPTKSELTNGPAKSALALGITKSMNGTKLFLSESQITIRYAGMDVQKSDIVAGPRVGMSIHVGPCSHRPWRFYIKDNPWVSKPYVVNYKW
jgi:DNA-3-methyladenine glycosylase